MSTCKKCEEEVETLLDCTFKNLSQEKVLGIIVIAFEILIDSFFIIENLFASSQKWHRSDTGFIIGLLSISKFILALVASLNMCLCRSVCIKFSYVICFMSLMINTFVLKFIFLN